ncbi:MAG: hypothetical protein IT480_10685 [Gammaproteobacteria bacterium]|nr:hypothetical protein [Gammaproteobacteria bacterium]
MARPASVPGEAPQPPQSEGAPPPPAPAAAVVTAAEPAAQAAEQHQPLDPATENAMLREQVQAQAVALEQMRDQIGQFKGLLEHLAAQKVAETAAPVVLPSRAEAEKLAGQPGAKAVLSVDGYVMPPTPRVVHPVQPAQLAR